MPRGPIELAAGLGVVAVNEDHVRLPLPARGQLVGKGNVPVNIRRIGTAPALSARDRAPGGPLGGAPTGWQCVRMMAERVDEMQLRVGSERAAESDRGGALVHPDLDHAPCPRRRLQQYRDDEFPWER